MALLPCLVDRAKRGHSAIVWQFCEKIEGCASALHPRARLAKVAAARGVALHHEIDVGIVHALAFSTRAYLKIDRVAVGAVDQAVRDATARLEAGGVAGLEHGLAVVLAKDQLALEHIDKFVFLLMPVAQCRGRTSLDPRDVDPELGQAHRVADSLLFTP